MELTDVIIKPIITEQSIDEAEKGKFTFRVAQFANKTLIKKAVEKRFGVSVVQTATRIAKGKRKKAGVRRVEIVEKSWKKATVTLKKGEKISLFDIGSQQASDEKKK